MKTLIFILLILISPVAAYCGVIELSEYSASLFLWLSEDIGNNPGPWGFAAGCIGIAIAILLLFFFEWLEAGRKTPDYQISMAKYRAESLIGRV